MAVEYAASLKNTRMTDVLNAIDAGVGAGTLEIATTGFTTVLVTFTLADPCGTVTGDTLNLDADPDITATVAASGEAAVARIKDSAGNVVVNNLTVGTAGANITVDSTTFTINTTATFTAGTITHG